MPLKRPSILGFTPRALAADLAERGFEAPIESCRRVLAHVISNGAFGLEGMKRPVARALREALVETYDFERPRIVEIARDGSDGFEKFLFEHADGALTEAVKIPLQKPGHYTVCLSSQVGCAMACAFCATGRLGLTRNLSAGEIVGAFLSVRAHTEGRVSGAVFMGQGEPLHNYDVVVRAAEVLNDPCGGRLSAEAISISTVGLVKAIRRYTAEGHPFRLVVSLTSAVEDRRRALLPVAGQIPLEELCDAIRDHAKHRGDRITVAWVLMGGVNTGEDEVRALAERLGDVPLRVNLIDVNDAREDGFVRASDRERAHFLDLLSELRVPLVRRYSGGKNAHAACGMLAATRQANASAAGGNVEIVSEL